MPGGSRVVLFAAVLWGVLCSTSGASENRRSPSWGVYVAPTAYRFASGPAFDAASSGTSLEFALLYTQPLSASIALGLEVRTVERRIVSTPLPDLPVSVSEQFVEVPVLVSLGRSLTEREVRVTFEGGLSYAILISQDLAAQPGASLPAGTPVELGFADYQRLAWLAGAGVALPVDSRTRAFACFRLQEDFEIFGESDDVRIAREYVAYGFHGGLEWSF